MGITVSTAFENELKSTVVSKVNGLLTLYVGAVTGTAFGTGAFGAGAFGGSGAGSEATFNAEEYLITLPNINQSIKIETEGRVGRVNNITLSLSNTETAERM